MDWEGELGVVVGRTAYKVSENEAGDCIAGFTVANDISMRGWQYRTTQWLQGKIWARSTPVGPFLVTPDEFDPATASCAPRSTAHPSRSTGSRTSCSRPLTWSPMFPPSCRSTRAT